jgi:hypothetical protein
MNMKFEGACSALVAAVIFLTVQSALWSAAAQANAPAIAGEYQCHCTQAEDKTYDITLAITPNDDTYYLAWFRQGQQVFEGIGLIVDGYLSAISVGNNGRNLVASSVIYKVAPGRLDGAWTGGDGKVYHEVCKKGSSNL